MTLDQIGERWNLLKQKIPFRREGRTDDAGKRDDLIGGRASSGDERSEVQATSVRPKDHFQRSDFSQHIGC